MAVALVLVFVSGCQFTSRDGTEVGVKINLGEVGLKFFHETKETSGEGFIRTDVDQGVQKWIGIAVDTDGDGENDTTIEVADPIEPDPG